MILLQTQWDFALFVAQNGKINNKIGKNLPKMLLKTTKSTTKSGKTTGFVALTVHIGLSLGFLP
ncbi:hypothetical protein [Gardnerella vaginalis]|uniref:hypothetical protein n=1 Tax=Gardnerella vaginalis TaxID=2702 RepID=UPI0009426215|nr:hypothetical protein [Gardnerella vaginalis]MDK8337557.1 hypothetical protein [Gardnerella vaginalis]NSX29683.1 hypothetical protein [Gardnerella vaginalis]UQA86374.1 hypothetical protein K9E39_01840 [Gardnerella vaginalis]